MNYVCNIIYKQTVLFQKVENKFDKIMFFWFRSSILFSSSEDSVPI